MAIARPVKCVNYATIRYLPLTNKKNRLYSLAAGQTLAECNLFFTKFLTIVSDLLVFISLQA